MYVGILFSQFATIESQDSIYIYIYIYIYIKPGYIIQDGSGFLGNDNGRAERRSISSFSDEIDLVVQ